MLIPCWNCIRQVPRSQLLLRSESCFPANLHSCRFDILLLLSFVLIAFPLGSDAAECDIRAGKMAKKIWGRDPKLSAKRNTHCRFLAANRPSNFFEQVAPSASVATYHSEGDFAARTKLLCLVFLWPLPSKSSSLSEPTPLFVGTFWSITCARLEERNDGVRI